MAKDCTGLSPRSFFGRRVPETAPHLTCGCAWHARTVKGTPVIERAGPRLLLSASVTVDHIAASRWARDLADESISDGRLPTDLVGALLLELLPDWFDDSLLVERVRWNQLRLHALEAVALKLKSEERYLAALEAALAATAIEPVRESAHRTVVEVYLAEETLLAP